MVSKQLYGYRKEAKEGDATVESQQIFGTSIGGSKAVPGTYIPVSPRGEHPRRTGDV
jgi:hypothetical protein